MTARAARGAGLDVTRARACRWLLASVAVLGTAEPGVAVAAGPTPLLQFREPRPAPLAFRDAGRINARYPIPIHDVSFAASAGRRVQAFLLVPQVHGPRPAVLYVHGSGGDRTQLLLQAAWMAARGAVALVVDVPPLRQAAAGANPLEILRGQRMLQVQTQVELRRALDVLVSLPEVDRTRLGYVGWSAGAKAGAILAGVDRRVRAFDLLSGGALPPSAYAAVAPRELRGAILRTLRDVDPLRYLASAPPAAVFLQDGRADRVVPRPALERLARAAPPGARVRWYGSGHWPGAPAFRDGLSWLSRRLGLGGPVVPGARTGP